MSLTPNTVGMAPAEAAAWSNATTSAPIAPSIVRLAWNAALPKGCSKLVLMCLSWHACKNERDECFPHVATIARLCNMHPRTASQHLKVLALAGLIAVTPRFNTSSVYRLIRGRLAALSSERTADAADPAQNPTALDPVLPASRPGDSCTHKGEEGGLKEEGRGNARAPAADQVEPAFPPLPIFEDPKPEQPARVAVDDVLTGIAGVQAEALPLIAEAVNRLIDAEQARNESQHRLVAQVAGAFGATPAPAIDSAQLAALNARRTAGGKAALTPSDLRDLTAEASLAGRTLGNLVELINARGWLFARADWKGVKVDAAPAVVPSEPTPQARAAAEAHAARMRAIDGPGTPASAATVTACIARLRGTAPKPATVSGSSTLALGSTGTGWARDAVARFVAGQAVAHATIRNAAAALKLSLADLKAQRAATQIEGAVA